MIGKALGKQVLDTEPENAAALEDDESEAAENVAVDEPEAGVAKRQNAVPAVVSSASSNIAREPVADDVPDLAELERAFHTAMIDVYKQAKQQASYSSTLFLSMVSSLGGLETAQQLLNAPWVSDGFTALWERKRLDLTVEAVVLQERFASLFTEAELDAARSRLTEYGYTP